MRYELMFYKAGFGDSESGVTIQEIDGLARPQGGVVVEGNSKGWFCSSPNQEGIVVLSPPMSEEEAEEAERLLVLGEEFSRKLRRRIEDLLRKGSIFSNLRIAEALRWQTNSLTIFNE